MLYALLYIFQRYLSIPISQFRLESFPHETVLHALLSLRAYAWGLSTSALFCWLLCPFCSHQPRPIAYLPHLQLPYYFVQEPLPPVSVLCHILWFALNNIEFKVLRRILTVLLVLFLMWIYWLDKELEWKLSCNAKQKFYHKTRRCAYFIFVVCLFYTLSDVSKCC